MFRNCIKILISSVIFYGVDGQYWPYYQPSPLRQEKQVKAAPVSKDDLAIYDNKPPEGPPETHERPPSQAAAENTEDLKKDLEKEKDERTTIPESDVLRALKVEAGTYSPFDDEFKYYNAQSMLNYSRPMWHETNRCNEDYLKCLTDMPIPQYVCSYHNYETIRGVKSQVSPCELYYKECRRGYRKWKIIGVGICFTDNGYWKFQTKPYRRFLDSDLVTTLVSNLRSFSDIYHRYITSIH